METRFSEDPLWQDLTWLLRRKRPEGYKIDIDGPIYLVKNPSIRAAQAEALAPFAGTHSPPSCASDLLELAGRLRSPETREYVGSRVASVLAAVAHDLEGLAGGWKLWG